LRVSLQKQIETKIQWKKNLPFSLITVLLCLFLSVSYAQEENALPDTIFHKKHNPNTAILYSAILPGLGQVYNRKFWKVPLVYGAGAAMVYAFNYNQSKYKKFKDAYANDDHSKKFIIDGNELTYEQLPLGRDFYRRYRDLSIFGIAAVYFLNIVDAMVDAYFTEFDVSDDLSLKIQPSVVDNLDLTAAVGVKISFGF
jgi:hypothetical protein